MKFSAPTTQISSAIQSTKRLGRNSQYTYPNPKWEADRQPAIHEIIWETYKSYLTFKVQQVELKQHADDDAADTGEV